MHEYAGSDPQLGKIPPSAYPQKLSTRMAQRTSAAEIPILDPAIGALYERRLVLVRPDGHVAWRGDDPPADPGALVDRVRGSA
jgi:hypothetical protein